MVKVTEKVVQNYIERLNRQDSKFRNKVRAVNVANHVLVERAVEKLQECLLEDTAHYFHSKIITECLVSPSS